PLLRDRHPQPSTSKRTALTSVRDFRLLKSLNFHALQRRLGAAFLPTLSDKYGRINLSNGVCGGVSHNLDVHISRNAARLLRFRHVAWARNAGARRVPCSVHP